MGMNKAVIILPTYNEADNIPILLPQIFAQQDKISSHELHVLIVDDNSPDGTSDVA
jgi:dolichol-phosphate mannosyltransferase